MRSKSPQTLFFQQPLPLSTSGIFYVKLSIMSSRPKLSFLCDSTLLPKMGDKNNPEQLEMVFRAIVSWKNFSRDLRGAPSKVQSPNETYKADLFPVPACLFSEAIKT